MFAPYMFLGFLFLQRPVHLIGWLINYLNKKTIFWKFTIYGLLSVVLALGPALILMLYLPSIIESGQDPIVAWYFNGHWFSWFILSLLLIRYGWNDIFKGLFAVAFVYATHETDWFFGTVTQFASPAYTGEAFTTGFFGVFRTIFFGYIPLMLTLLAILVSYFFAWRIFSWKKEILILAVPAVWAVIAIATGFPNTINVGAVTQYYGVWWVNLAEVLTWAIPTVIAMLPDDLKIFRSNTVSITAAPVIDGETAADSPHI